MDYSFLIVVAAGMMKMATGDDLPLRQGAGTGFRLVFMDTEACSGGTYDLGLPRGFLEYLGFYRVKRGAEGHRGGQNPPGRAWGARRALVGCAPSGHPPKCCSGPMDVFWSIKIHKKFRGVWTLFDIDFLRCKKQVKNSNWHWVSWF